MKLSESPLAEHESLSESLGVSLYLKRDDLLPFPLAGNKFRKLRAEIDGRVNAGDTVVTNGGVDSNHCRTLAMLGATEGFAVHLILHGEADQSSSALCMLDALGATYEIVAADGIAHAIARASSRFSDGGAAVKIIAGGCHTVLGAQAYRLAAEAALPQCQPDYIVAASGTGATQGGLVAATRLTAPHVKVIGISVARTGERGTRAVQEAAAWAGADSADVTFLDSYRDGGYGVWGASTEYAVQYGWGHGLPLDPTYTGKAFAGMLDLIRRRHIEPGSRVLFWHTGGLWNALQAMQEQSQRVALRQTRVGARNGVGS